MRTFFGFLAFVCGLSFYSQASLAADPLLFNGGNGTTQIDQYTGIAGGGWDTAWGRSSAATGTTTVSSANPLTPGGGNYLAVNLLGTDRNVYREYGNTLEFNVNSVHTISWDWRMDSPYVASGVNDRINFFANPTQSNASTTSSNTWVIGVAPNSVGHSNWYFYDLVNQDASGLTATNQFNTGMPLVQGTTYNFSVTIDPINSIYSATISNGVNSVTKDNLHFRSPTPDSSYLHFGVKSSSQTKPLAFSLDNVQITGGSPQAELPTVGGFNGIWYFNQNIGGDYNYKYSGGFGTYTHQMDPFAYYSPEANKTFFTYGGTNANNSDLYHMVSYYDHATGQVARPRLLLAKGTTDAHDNPTIMLDDEGYIFVFSNSHGTARQSFISRSTNPYDISSFERVLTMPTNNNFSYSQPLFVEGEGFMFLHTQYVGSERTLKFNTSADGITWDHDWSTRPTIVDLPGGQYQMSDVHGQTVGTAFNYHPNAVVNNRTNLYYIQTSDMGQTWTTVDGTPLTIPVTQVTNEALVYDYESEGLRVYLKDLRYDDSGNPILMYLTTTQWQPGPLANDEERTWHIAHYKNNDWQIHDIFTSDHNYDFGSLYIEEGQWKIIAPTDAGPQEYGTGGEMVMWVSQDEGVTWEATKQLTYGSPYNHTYAREAVNVHPDFYAFWADGNPLEKSESRFYFTDKEGTGVWQLPWAMEDDFATPEKVFDPFLLVQPADFDDDGVVDAGDLVVWQTNYGTATGANRLTGDADSDGDVDGSDFLLWQADLGKSIGNPDGIGSGAEVPEPNSLLLGLLGVVLLGIARMRI